MPFAVQSWRRLRLAVLYWTVSKQAARAYTQCQTKRLFSVLLPLLAPADRLISTAQSNLWRLGVAYVEILYGTYRTLVLKLSQSGEFINRQRDQQLPPISDQRRQH